MPIPRPGRPERAPFCLARCVALALLLAEGHAADHARSAIDVIEAALARPDARDRRSLQVPYLSALSAIAGAATPAPEAALTPAMQGALAQVGEQPVRERGGTLDLSKLIEAVPKKPHPFWLHDLWIWPLENPLVRLAHAFVAPRARTSGMLTIYARGHARQLRSTQVIALGSLTALRDYNSQTALADRRHHHGLAG